MDKELQEQATIYTWSGNPCVRSNVVLGWEEHPCYYCGVPFKIDGATYCPKCEFILCPTCGRGFCNTPPDTQVALRRLRDKYCCNLENFRSGFKYDEEDGQLLLYAPHFPDALNYCRGKPINTNFDPGLVVEVHNPRRVLSGDPWRVGEYSGD